MSKNLLWTAFFGIAIVGYSAMYPITLSKNRHITENYPIINVCQKGKEGLDDQLIEANKAGYIHLSVRGDYDLCPQSLELIGSEFRGKMIDFSVRNEPQLESVLQSTTGFRGNTIAIEFGWEFLGGEKISCMSGSLNVGDYLAALERFEAKELLIFPHSESECILVLELDGNTIILNSEVNIIELINQYRQNLFIK